MADEQITVEWIATAQQMLATIQKVDARLDKQEKAMQKLGDTSKKAADGAVNSFNRVEQELRENEAALKRLAIGSKEFDLQRKKVDALRVSLAAMKSSMTAGASAASTAMTAGIGKLQQMAAGMIGLHQVVQAIVAELDKVQQMNMAAAGAQRTVEASIAEMALNIGAPNVAPARAMIAENAPKLGVTQEGLANMLAGAMSAGAKDLTEAMDLAGKTLKLTAGDAAKAGPIMSGMLTLAATTGNRDFESTLGQLSQFQKAGRGEDFAMSINNMSTAIAAANAKGERVAALGSERTLEMSAAISQLLQDPTMAVTGTTVRQMVQKMDAFVPKASATLDDGTKSKLDPAVITAFNGLDTIDKRIDAMRADPEIAKQFLSTIEQNQGKVAIREIVTGSDTAKAEMAEAEATITGPQQAKVEYDALIAAISEQTLALRSQNRSAANIQGAATDAESLRGIEGQVTQIVQNTLDSVNMSGLDMARNAEAGVVRAAAAGDTAATIDAGIGTLEAMQQQAFLGGIGAGLPVGGQVSAQDKQLMQDQIALLKDIRDELRQRQPQRAGLPAARPREAALPGALQP